MARIADLPDAPGIYVFRDGAGRPLYVGKARRLRRRVRSYQRPQQDARLAAMLREATDLEYLVTDSELDALVLENRWIKHHRPRYNVLRRDDKTYPYLVLTTGEPWPRLYFTRRVRRRGAATFGPFLPASSARRALRLVQRLFGRNLGAECQD